MILGIRNFRSVQGQEVELAPLTVVYGPNGAGKSSLVYALPTLRNIILNPNQASAGFFNFTFITLGGFEAVVFDHQQSNKIGLAIRVEERSGYAIDYAISFTEAQATFAIRATHDSQEASAELSVPLPYPANQQAAIQFPDLAVAFVWNGITAQISGSVSPEQQATIQRLVTALNKPVEILRKTTIVPLRRGFSKPLYTPVAATTMLASEEEVATMLLQNKYLVSKVSFYLEQVVGRDFRINVQPGTGLFSLDALDKKSGIGTELVNEGFGVNQLVYFLAKCLQPDVEWVCVEEPEIHLHPSALRQLVAVLVHLVRVEGKKFLISTHSEPFVSSILTEVLRRDLKPTDVACYLARKDKRVTTFERQQINEQGQLEGGLMSFMEGELEDVKAFLRTE